jgi:hypothetical protein
MHQGNATVMLNDEERLWEHRPHAPSQLMIFRERMARMPKEQTHYAVIASLSFAQSLKC